MSINKYLPELSVTAYNGYRIPVGVHTTSYRVTPKFDAARRTVSYCTFEIGLRWYIAAPASIAEMGGTTSPQVRDMQAKLMVTGGQLTYDARGTWPEQTNSSRYKDVAFGPHPGPLSIEPYGGGLALKVEWSVTFSLPVCDDAVFDGVLEWNYGVSSGFDADGVETRSVSGHLIVANNRATPGSRAIARNADTYREKVETRTLPNFRITGRSYRLSEDKSRLDYELSYTETGPNAPGPYITSAEASESVSNERAGNLALWQKTIRASYTVVAGQSVSVAWDAFFRLVNARIVAPIAKLSGIAWTPVSFSAEDPALYAPRQRVSMSMTVRIGGLPLYAIFSQTGMWEPVPQSNWRKWMGTVADALGPRGALQVHFDMGGDAIVDACRRTTITPTSGTQPVSVFEGILRNNPDPSSETIRRLAELASAPKPENSWLYYEAFTEIITDPGTAVGKTLPDAPYTEAELKTGETKGFWDAGKNGLPNVVNAVIRAAVPPSKGETFVQQRVSPTYYVRFYGKAARSSYPIPEPTITTVGGMPVTPVKEPGTLGHSFRTGISSNSGQPVHVADWNKLYVVPEFKAAPPPPNETYTDLRGGR